MPTGGKKPTSASLSEVLEGLLKTGVDFILVGGLAAVVQGAPVTTMDVDIVHSQSPENVARLLAFLKSVDAVHRRLDDKLIEPSEHDLYGKGHVHLMTRSGPLDVSAVIEGEDPIPSLSLKIEIIYNYSWLWIFNCRVWHYIFYMIVFTVLPGLPDISKAS